MPENDVVRLNGRVYFLLIALQIIFSLASLGTSLYLQRLYQDSSEQHRSLQQERQQLLAETAESASNQATLKKIQSLDANSWALIDKAQQIRAAKVWFEGVSVLLMSLAVAGLLRLHFLLKAQSSRKISAEAALRAERATLEKRIENRTAELRAEVEERRRAEQLNRGRNRVLELLARNRPVPEILQLLTETVADQRSSWGCVLHLVSKSFSQLELANAADLPESLVKHLGKISSAFEDAPESAALRQGSVHVVAHLDQVRRPWSELLHANGIQSVWSAPFFSSEGRLSER